MSSNRDFELPKEFLELITGGSMTAEEEEQTRTYVSGFKKSGFEKETVIGLVRMLAGLKEVDMMSPNSNYSVEECIQFIDKIWDES